MQLLLYNRLWTYDLGDIQSSRMPELFVDLDNYFSEERPCKI